MPSKHATVKSPDSAEPPPRASARAESIRLRLADAWGEMGAAWGVAPAIARVHAYLMARREPLTEREIEVLVLVGKGMTNKAIAVQLGISDRTVQNHLANIFSKLQAESRTEAVMRAVSLGLIEAGA